MGTVCTIGSIMVGLAALGASACDAGRERDGSPSSSIASSAPEIVTPNVTWPPASTLDQSALAALADDARAQVTRSVVPVLVPRGVSLSAATVIVGTEFYAFTVQHDGLTIAIHGTRAARRYDGIGAVPGDKRLRGGDGFVTENESVRRATWIEGGVAYSADIECATPTERRCAEEAFVTSFVDGLTYVGGAGQ